MWERYERERAIGRTPTGAELDRIAGTKNYGRKVLRRWNENGQRVASSEQAASTIASDSYGPNRRERPCPRRSLSFVGLYLHDVPHVQCKLNIHSGVGQSKVPLGELLDARQALTDGVDVNGESFCGLGCGEAGSKP